MLSRVLSLNSERVGVQCIVLRFNCKRLACYRPDGQLVKLLLSSTLVDKSPLTFIYFTTFEKKRRVRSPLST